MYVFYGMVWGLNLQLTGCGVTVLQYPQHLVVSEGGRVVEGLLLCTLVPEQRADHLVCSSVDQVYLW